MAIPRVKICGLTRREDLLLAREAGADFVGAVLVPESPRAVDTQEARELFADAGVPTVAVVVGLDLGHLVGVGEAVDPTILQLHGDESPGLVESLRAEGPWQIWKAVAVREPEDVLQAADRYGALVDGMVLDAWDPQRRGGTGSRFPWERVRSAIRHLEGGPAFVAAGGLKVQNVLDAIALLRPDVLDVSSGVEVAPGVKDPELVRRFIRTAKQTEAGGQG